MRIIASVPAPENLDAMLVEEMLHHARVAPHDVSYGTYLYVNTSNELVVAHKPRTDTYPSDEYRSLMYVKRAVELRADLRRVYQEQGTFWVS